MWVWDSSTYAATSHDEGGPISTYRWESSEEDMMPALPADASRGEVIGRMLGTGMLAVFVGFMFWAL